MMDSTMFRKLAEHAVDQMAEFLDAHPDSGFYPVMRITTKFGTVVVGVEKTRPPDEDDEEPSP